MTPRPRPNSKLVIDDEPIVPEVHMWRSFHKDDLDSVIHLEDESAHQLFGSFDVETMTELSGHSVVVVNQLHQIIACVCLRSYPNIPALLPEVWPEVFQTLYGTAEHSFENTLFVHMFLCDRRYNWDFLVRVFRTLFLCVFRLQYVVMVMPPAADQFAHFSRHTMSKFFVRILPKVGRRSSASRSAGNYQNLFVSLRSRVVQPLKIRYAVAEDNDDVVNIMDRTSPQLKQLYGEFYIAEIVLNTESSRKMIVAEQDGEVVGMLCFTNIVSLPHLARTFDLSAFNGLRKPQLVPLEQMVYSVSEYKLFSPKDSLLPKKTAQSMTPLIHTPDNISSEEFSTMRSGQSVASKLIHVSENATSTEEFLNLLKQTYNIVSNSSISNDSSSEDSNPNAKETITPYERQKQQTRHYHVITENTVRSLEYDVGFESDIFMIELHCMHHDIDERRALDLVVASFETFPDLSYCLISFPAHTRSFPLLSFFVNLSTRTMFMSFPRTKVFLLQRNALFSAIVVGVAELEDEDEIKLYLKTIVNSEFHTNVVMSACQQFHNDIVSDVYPIVIRCLDTIIGICVIHTYHCLARLKLHFEIDTYIASKHHSHYNQVGMLQMMMLHPAFLNRLPFVRSEIFRITGFTSLFFKINENMGAADVVLNTMLSEMVPVRPRIRMTYQTDLLLPEQLPNAHVLHAHLKKPYALYHQNVALCTKRKVLVGDRIIVVGCSSTALSFLEELLFRKESQHSWFTSITMISPNGLAAKVFEDISDLAKGYFFEQKYTPDYIRRLGLSVWIDVVFSSVNKIDRQTKNVHICDGRIFPYDRLFLFCGLQFDYPIKVKVPEHQPKNVAFLNNAREAELLVLRVKTMQETCKECAIVVYGDSIHCYSCIELLLQLKVPSSCITYVRPKAKEKIAGCTTLFNDPFIDTVMEKLLESSDIKVLENYDIVDWILDKDNSVTKINVSSDLMVLELECSLFVCFERKIVMRRTIRVLNEAGLVFDGRLVINSKFETNDPSIFAAGPMTKYKRILYADKFRHQYFSSIEIGARLGRRVFDHLNPARSHSTKVKVHTIPGTVHQFKEPLIQYRPTLDGYRFLCIRNPGPPIPYEMMKSSDRYGTDLVTSASNDNCTWGAEDVRYFRCHLDEYNKICSIVCLTRGPINVLRLLSIWGQHESLLRNLRLRFDAGLIKNFFTHFSEPWIYLIYHDMYRRELNAKNLHATLEHVDPYLNLIKETRYLIVLNGWERLTESERERLVDAFLCTSYRDLVHQNLMDFLYDHKEDLPNYCEPHHSH